MVNEEDPSHHITTEVLLTEVTQLRIMESEANKALEEVQKDMKIEMQTYQKLEQQIEPSKTLSDDLQRQIETLQVELAELQASSSDICERTLCSFFIANYSTPKSKKEKNVLLVINLTHFFDSGQLWTMPFGMVFIEHNMLLLI